MRVAIYARVSKDLKDVVQPDGSIKRVKKKQNPEAQLLELRRLCEFRRFDVVDEFIDYDTGSKVDRPALERLRERAKLGEFDWVVAWKFDRIFRSLRDMNVLLDEFAAYGVKFMTMTQNADRGTPEGRLFVNMLGSIAEFEREIIVERTKMGLAYARSKGKVLGRPKKRDDLAIHQLRKKHMSIRKIAKELNCSISMVNRALK